MNVTEVCCINSLNRLNVAKSIGAKNETIIVNKQGVINVQLISGQGAKICLDQI